jgi:hypothetical protein
MANILQLCDARGQLVATVEVEMMTADLVQGTIIEQRFTPDIIRMFEAFQEMVEHQMFGYLDQFEQYTAALNLRVLLDETLIPLYDLQVYDLRQISFRLEMDEAIQG